MFRRYRIISQTVCFALFCGVFFFINKYPEAYRIPGDLFLQLNPLTALLVSVASRHAYVPLLLTGCLVGALTVLFGRFFCGFICPLGAAIDLSDTVLFKKARSKSRRPPRYLQRLKYVILSGFGILALSGAIFPLFMDPVSLITRGFTVIIYPLVAFTGSEVLAAGEPLLSALGLETALTTTITVPVFFGIPLTVLLLVTVFAGGFWDKRFWCQYLCPSGALFGLLGRYAFFRRVKLRTGCPTCTSCESVCPTRAIRPPDGARTNTSECIECGLCAQSKAGCGVFRMAIPRKQSTVAPDLRRRHFLFGAASGALLIPVFKATGTGTSDGHGTLIRPPGAIPEKEFLTRCITCGICMKACPANALQPCMPDDGFVRLSTPKLVPRIGGCDSKCHVCGYVCPTGALRKIALDDKPYMKLGTAVIDRHRCIAWAQNKECLVCDEVCPYNAIAPRLVLTAKGPFKVPIAREDLCMGCGLCEMQCPVFDKAAIEVYRFGENRRLSGPYMSYPQRQNMDALRASCDMEAFPAEPRTGDGDSAPRNDSPSGAPPLPPGFNP